MTDSGKITGAVTVASGALFASGTITGNLTASGGIVTPGTAATKTGTLTDVGVYSQHTGGSLDIDIAGTTAGTQYDVLKSTTAALGGTLNLTTGFAPTVGSTFKILIATSDSDTFATVNGGEDRVRLGEALRPFNADYAPGGKQAVAAANNATLSKQRVAEHISELDRYKVHR